MTNITVTNNSTANLVRRDDRLYDVKIDNEIVGIVYKDGQDWVALPQGASVHTAERFTTLHAAAIAVERAVRRNTVPVEIVPTSIEELSPAESVRLPINVLELDPSYQRSGDHPDSIAQVNRIVSEFQLWMMDPLKVNKRDDGRYYVIDGGHRLRALRQMGPADRVINVMLHTGLTMEQEAELFANQRNRTRSLTPMNIAKAALAAGQEDLQLIRTALGIYGLRLELETYNRPRQENWNKSIQAISTLQSILRLRGEQGLLDVLSLIYDCWGTEEYKAYSADMMKGVAQFLDRFEDTYDRARFVQKMKDVSAEYICRQASGKDQPRYVRAMVEQYNKNLSNNSRKLEVRTKAGRSYHAGAKPQTAWSKKKAS